MPIAAVPLRIQTLGGFRVWRDGVEIEPSAWSREKAVHLFQFLVTSRRKRHLHKEVIIDRLWPTLDADTGDRDFKVALNALNKAIEPDRKPRAEPRFIDRVELTYGLHLAEVEVDADVFEAHLTAAHAARAEAPPGAVPDAALQAYRAAVACYAGDYLPERRYEDWTSAERERLQSLALAAMTTLADLLVERDPVESLRLTERALALDPVWENAYRTQMRAHMATGNRPMALRTYARCRDALDEAFGIEPLPETEALHARIRGA